MNNITFLRSIMVVSFSSVVCNNVTCPTSVPIGPPCKYIQNDDCTIYCTGNQTFDVKQYFDELNSRLPADMKIFTRIVLNQLNIEELPANAFADIQFQVIYVQGNSNLQRIHRNAFNGTTGTVTYLLISGGMLNEQVTNNNDLFGALNTLKSVETIGLSGGYNMSLPSMAISGLTKLTSFTYDGKPLNTIATHAFNDLPLLEVMTLAAYRMADHAFTVNHNHTEQQLTINFISNDESFGYRALEMIGCPTTIWFGQHGKFKFLDRVVFEGFLAENPLNTVIDEDIDCAYAGNAWIHDNYPKVWADLKCK